MSMKDFIADFKEMVKTKDMTKVNQKYLKPAFEKTQEAAVIAKDFVVKYTPVAVEAAKKGWDKAYEVVQKRTQKPSTTSETKTGSTMGSPTPSSTDSTKNNQNNQEKK